MRFSICVLPEAFLSCRRYAEVPKWLTRSLFSYAAVVFVVHVCWGEALLGSLPPTPALRPIAGDFAGAVFAIGILGTGLLAVPVLAGSAVNALFI